MLTDGKITPGETGAIIQYIPARYGENRLVPPVAGPEFADYLYRFHFSNASLVAGCMAEMAFSTVPGKENYPVLAVFSDRAAWKKAKQVADTDVHFQPDQS